MRNLRTNEISFRFLLDRGTSGEQSIAQTRETLILAYANDF